MRLLTLNHIGPAAWSDAAVWRYGKRSITQPHTHTFHEVFWIESGDGWHAINGQRRPMTPGYLALIHASDVHTFTAASERVEMRLCNVPFRTEIWTRVRRRFFAGRGVFFDEPNVARREYQLDPVRLERVRAFAADLLAGANDQLTTETFITALCVALANQTRRDTRTGGAPEWLEAAREAIRTYPHFADGVAAFVRFAGRSPEHVTRECRRHFGCTPRDLVTEARLGHAATRLCTSSQSIVEIALECGFENLGHFYTLFRRRYGATPRAYRLGHGAPERGRRHR